MERITISVSDAFAAELAGFMAANRYANRSEAVRDLARRGLEQARLGDDTGTACLATLSYVYDHHTRDLARRLTEAHHAHHDLHVATLHVHLDHTACLEVAVLRGSVGAVRDFSTAVIAERGVSHGHVTLVPVAIEEAAPGHGNPGHTHIHPRA